MMLAFEFPVLPTRCHGITHGYMGPSRALVRPRVRGIIGVVHGGRPLGYISTHWYPMRRFMPLKRPIKSLPSANATAPQLDVAVSVVPMSFALVATWAKYVQPLIDGHYQHDVPGQALSNVRADVRALKARKKPCRARLSRVATWSERLPSTLACPDAVNAAPGAGPHVLRSLDGDAFAKNGAEDFHFCIAKLAATLVCSRRCRFTR